MKQKRILVVDDDPSVLKFVCKVAESMSYDVLKAEDGLKAMLAFSNDPAIDALVTDVKMPGVNGFQLAHALRSKNPGLPILFISGYFEESEVPEELRMGPETFLLSKPFVRNELGAALLLLLISKTPFEDELPQSNP